MVGLSQQIEFAQPPTVEVPEEADAPYLGWVELVARIQAAESDSQAEGMRELYELFSTGVRYYLIRHLGPQELEDKVHDTFLVVVQAIRRGELREPSRLMGFVRTIVRRQVAAHIEKIVQGRKERIECDGGLRMVDPAGSPEEVAIFEERKSLIHQILSEIPERDREILTRFYLREQGQEQICREMGLSDTQFRLLKSRAKARFGELGKKRLFQRSLPQVLLRSFPSPSH